MSANTPNPTPTPPASSAGSGLPLEWRVHTPRLLEEIAKHSGQAVLLQPIRILGRLLAEVGERAAQLNDPALNALMCRLTIYTVADPDSQDYDPEVLRSVLSHNPERSGGRQ